MQSIPLLNSHLTLVYHIVKKSFYLCTAGHQVKVHIMANVKIKGRRLPWMVYVHGLLCLGAHVWTERRATMSLSNSLYLILCSCVFSLSKRSLNCMGVCPHKAWLASGNKKKTYEDTKGTQSWRSYVDQRHHEIRNEWAIWCLDNKVWQKLGVCPQSITILAIWGLAAIETGTHATLDQATGILLRHWHYQQLPISWKPALTTFSNTSTSPSLISPYLKLLSLSEIILFAFNTNFSHQIHTPPHTGPRPGLFLLCSSLNHHEKQMTFLNEESKNVKTSPGASGKEERETSSKGKFS